MVGSLMSDLVVRVPRMPAVGESLIGHSFELFPGGKGANQAIAAARAGASEVFMIGRVGDDPFAGPLLAALAADRVDATFVTRDPEAGTGVAVPIVLDDGTNSIVAIPRANLCLDAADIRAAAGMIASADMLVVNFEVGMEAVEEAMRVAHTAGVRVLLNPAPIAPHSPALFRFSQIVVANEIEASALAPGCDGDHAREAMALLARGPAAVVVTLGEGGALFATQDERCFVPVFRVTAVDSVGAGDAFCGALSVALCERAPLADAVRIASAAGALATTKAGAIPSLPVRAAIDDLLAR